MMEKWSSVRVGDLGQVITGKTPKTSIQENYGGNIPFLTPSDDMSVKYVFFTKKTLTDRGMAEVKNVLLPKNTVCVSCIGSDLGKVVITSETTVTNQQINSIIVDKERFDVHFVYYAMLILGKELNIISKTSTAVPIVNKSLFSSYEIMCPSLSTQRRISSILSALDSKIECNQRINDNLSEILQTIYQQRFNKSEQTAESGILADICSYSKYRVAVSSLSLSTYYSTENILPGKAGAVDASSLPAVAQTTKCKVGDVLISNIRPYFKKIVYCQFECGCSTDVLCFTPKTSELSAYLYCTLYTDRFFNFMVAGSKGTKMPRGDKQQIMTYSVYEPTDVELKEFNGIAQPILTQIESNRLENIELSLLRDSLIPKLVSGEIAVSHIQL